jgi:hypothetical protein
MTVSVACQLEMAAQISTDQGVGNINTAPITIVDRNSAGCTEEVVAVAED